MSSFLISYPDIPATALVVSPTQTWDSTYSLQECNLWYGERHDWARLASATTGISITFDLGVSTTKAVDHFILGGVQLLRSNGVTEARLQGSADASSWANQLGTSSNFQTRTLSGPNGHDVVFTQAFNDTIAASLTSYRYWRFFLSGGSHKFPLSKAYFGTFFNMGKEPDYFEVTIVDDDVDPWRYPRGHVMMTKSTHPRHQILVEWDGVTDAKATEFNTKILSNPTKRHVFLYTATYHDVLFGNRSLHAKVLSEECSISKVKQDWNNVSAVFTEMV